MKYIFIVNPISGNDNKQKIFNRIQSAFRLIDDEMIVEQTHYSGHAKEIAENYAKKFGEECVIVSCGGDGTIHEIANGIAHTNTPLMVLPLGTGNDFAKKIYGTKKINVDNVIKAFGLHNGQIKYDVQPIDLIDYNGEKCINVMSYGLDTKIVKIGKRISTKAPFIGHNSYNIAIVPALAKPLRYYLNIDLDCIDENNKPYKIACEPFEYALLAICNASYYGGGFCPAPNSIIDDGILNFTYLDSLKVRQALPIIPKYSAGTAAQDYPDFVHTGYVTGGRVWTEDGTPLLGNCDGEIFDYNEVIFKVDKHALKLCAIKG